MVCICIVVAAFSDTTSALLLLLRPPLLLLCCLLRHCCCCCLLCHYYCCCCLLSIAVASTSPHDQNFGVGRGKHNPPEWRGKHTEPAYDTKANPRATELALDSILPVVLIKDPLTWMGSMCRHKYKAQGGWLKGDICPNFFESERSDVWFRYTSTKKGTDLKGLQLESYQKFMGGFRGYPSLLHMWRDWYQAYFNYSTPRLMVRYEDLLFNQNQTLHEICACAGGRMSESTRTTADSSKDDHSKAESSDRDSSLRRYKSAKSRVTKCKRIGELKDLASTSLCNDTAYTHQDLDYVNKTPGVQELMNAFKYSTDYSYIEPSLV